MRSPFKPYGRGLAAGGPILNLASAAGATPLAPAADVTLLYEFGLRGSFGFHDVDDATAPEGHAVAAALAADRQAARLVRDAGELVEFAEASIVRALQMLSCVGAEDPMRPLIDRVFIETTRVKNELVGVVEKFHQVGVGS